MAEPQQQDAELTPACTVCVKAEKMGGAIRCMACGRWVPRVDRRKASAPGHTSPATVTGPRCPRCKPDEQRPRATIRLPYRVFYKCDRCLSVWSVDAQR